MRGVRVTDLGLLAGAFANGLHEDVSVLRSAEPVVLDLDEVDDALVPPGARALRHLPAPTVLVGPPGRIPAALVAAADVCLTTEADPPAPWVHAPLDAVAAAVARQPLAALSLVALLRMSERLDVLDAIAAESATYALLLGSGPFHEWLAARGPGAPKRHERPAVVVTRDGDHVAITLDRPEARNAIDTATRDALVEALAAISADPSASVELRGNGPCFSAGGDLQEFGTVGDPATAHAVRLTRHPGASVHAVADRATCFVHGPCVGAGIEVPAFASTVVADPAATFSLPEVGFGLVPGAGGTVSIPRRIGRQRAAWLALTGERIDGPAALAWGLVDRLEPVSG